MTHCKPFARTFANRVWYQLIGRGIIDPPDDHNQENRPVNQELLQFLAKTVEENDFQIKPFFKAICLTKTYQRKCATAEHDEQLRRVFAARQTKPMLPEQYIDSFVAITNFNMNPAQRRQAIWRLVGDRNINEDFQKSWDYLETDQQLMERLATNLPTNNTGKLSLQDLYLTVLTREPTAVEEAHCQSASNADVLFALLFGNEFFFSH